MSLFGVFGAEAIFGDVISDGLASMQSALSQYGGAGTDPGVPFGAAVRGLQAAGNAAVNVVGPAIDILGGSDPKTMTMTQRIWRQNGQLAAVRGDDAATRDDWQSAVSIFSDMTKQYGVASRYAKSLHAPPPRPKAAPAPAYVAPTTPAAAPLAPLPSSVLAPPSPAPETGLDPATKTTIAVSTGGVFGLLLGGAVGLRAGARVGLFVGGPVGALVGAAAGWGLMRVIAPAPAAQVAVASK